MSSEGLSIPVKTKHLWKSFIGPEALSLTRKHTAESRLRFPPKKRGNASIADEGQFGCNKKACELQVRSFLLESSMRCVMQWLFSALAAALVFPLWADEASGTIARSTAPLTVSITPFPFDLTASAASVVGRITQGNENLGTVQLDN